MTLLSTSKVFDGGAMALQLGGELTNLEVAYESYGTLANDGANAILICHGYTSNPNAAGWWSGLIGPGKALDTDRWFVVCCNMLGSAYGSSGPPSMNPDSGKPYGPEFPELTLADMANAQDRVLRALGVERLAAIVGYSFGGQLALQWATAQADRMNAVVDRLMAGPERRVTVLVADTPELGAPQAIDGLVDLGLRALATSSPSS